MVSPVISLKRHLFPIWYRVSLVRCDLGSTLTLPLAAHSLEEARERALGHYRTRYRNEEIEVIEVQRLSPVRTVTVA